MSNPRLEELRSKFQENPRRYFAPFANELRKAGDPTQAIAVCRTHLASQPGHVSGHIVLGQALYEAGEKAEARVVFTTALDLDPENLIALRTLGEIAQVNGEFGVAREWYVRLLDADPRNHEVAQLLKDIPDEMPAAASTTPSATVVVDEPTPPSAHEEIAAVEAPAQELPVPPAPRFHTAYTGAMPAYDPDRLQLEPTAPPVPEAEPSRSDVPFVDLQPTAHVEIAPEWNEVTEPHNAAPDAIDVVAFEQGLDTAAAPAPVESMPDELLDFAIEATSEAVASPEFIQPIEAEIESPVPASVQPVESPAEEPAAVEPPHAVFAEHGFDGPVNDEIGWLKTPSAAYSDLEAAPEDWYSETEEQEQESEIDQPEPVTIQAEEPQEVSSGAAPSDSWFDEPVESEAVESVEMATDDFWLPPELPQVTNVVEPSAEPVVDQEPALEQEPVVEQEPVLMPEPTAAASLPDETSAFEEPVIAHYEQEPMGEGADVHVVAEAAEEAIFVEHPAEPEAVAAAPSLEFSTEGQEVHDAHATAAASFDDPPVMDSAAVMGHSPEMPDAAPSPTPAPFITETLAELYLQQGFKDEALSIYRQLLERNPSSQSLKDRIEAIERTETPEPVVSSEEATERAASQSVRTFFSRLARRQATMPTASAPSDAEPIQPDAAPPDVPFASAASALANMFAASKPSVADETAASTLSGAFSDPAGRPSRAAERELSLDHLFRDVAPVGPQGVNVTLDEFYSTPGAATGSSTEPEAGPDEPAGSDIRQFTAWLEGLRKK